jgi:hypothetical protein
VFPLDFDIPVKRQYQHTVETADEIDLANLVNVLHFEMKLVLALQVQKLMAELVQMDEYMY